MSIGGPCLWVPPLSTQAPSPLSAVSRHVEWVSATPRRILSMSHLPRDGTHFPHLNPSPAEMQRTMATADHGLSHPVSDLGRPSGIGAWREGDMAAHDGAEKAPTEMGGMKLPQIKLNIPTEGHTGRATLTPPAGIARSGDSADAARSDFDQHDENDRHSPESQIDEKGDGTEDNDDSQSPIIDKKKMKRFRLTHNQTRFLMSEFTRQAHPDAAHRERLSREIPGLTPRQVQVWFQNRRAKLKRLTTNDRERMLKSRALPDDFDTTKVLRTPFESKSVIPTAMGAPHDFGAPNPDFASLRSLRTDCFPRPNEDEYMTSPLSSASTAGTYMSSAGRSDGLPSSGMPYGRPLASSSMSDLHRTTIRNDYSITRSSSMSDGSSNPPSFHPTLHMHNRFASSPTNPGLPYMRQPVMDYTVPRHPSSAMGPPFEQQPSQQTFESSASPTNSQGTSMTYEMNTITPKNYGAHAMSSHVSPHGLPVSTMHTLPASQDFRPYSYTTTPTPIASMPYASTSASTLSLPTSFGPAEANIISPNEASQHQTQSIDSLREKFGSQTYNYSNYIQQ
ncbi:hypothetical protein PDE_05741 [Penicillium oxalicum 114-2]|uniref:Homeobox domain-containing protein n=1 Tax=Penicillium oxalicum (strain 114-2 / CGMCC 5302) TaxID=933388 RepID=S7ZKH0_PENO1|nr:hypothetical protein PDE_05741 [Penicillium oxalicum 114-2]